jgi:hypothetical protein
MPKLRVPVDMPKNEVTAAVDMPKRRAAMANLYIAFFFLHVDAWYPPLGCQIFRRTAFQTID